MATATTFSRQNDAGSRAHTAWYWNNLVLVVVLVLESKALSSAILKIEWREEPKSFNAHVQPFLSPVSLICMLVKEAD